MQAGFKFVKSFDEGVERVVNGTFAFLNSEGALRWVQNVCVSSASIKPIIEPGYNDNNM